MIDCILFDLDDTIFDFKKAERCCLTKMLNDFGYSPTEKEIERYSEINLSQWKRLETGELTHGQVKVKRYEIFFKEIGLNRSGVEGTKRYEEYLAKTFFFIDGAEKLLDSLSKKYRLFIVSNGLKKDQEGRIKKAKIEKYFERIFNSQELGYSKPDIRFFESCFENIKNFDKEKAVLIGDSLTSDIKGGINAGLKTIWLNRRNEKNTFDFSPDFEIKSLSEVESALKSI